MGISVGNKFGFPVHKMPAGSSKLAIPYAKVGVELECENVTNINDTKGLLANWQHVEDHSLRNHGREFITRGTGLVGTQLVSAVTNLCQFLTESDYSIGYPRAGIHLHIDMTDMNEESHTELLNCVLSYILFEEAIFKYAGNWRKACGFCDPLSLAQRDFPAISKLLYGWELEGAAYVHERRFSKYQAINFLPLARFGTIEFRQLSTTFDSQRILDWINLCLSFKRYGKQVNIDPVDYLEKHGCKALADVVFGEQLPIIAEHIVEADVYNAIADARSLRVGRGMKPLHMPWGPADNPLLTGKKEKPKAVRKSKVAVEDNLIGIEDIGAPGVVRPRLAGRRTVQEVMQDFEAQGLEVLEQAPRAAEIVVYRDATYVAPGASRLRMGAGFASHQAVRNNPARTIPAVQHHYNLVYGEGSWANDWGRMIDPIRVALFLNEFYPARPTAGEQI